MSLPNFGHWRVRAVAACRRAHAAHPTLDYDWYDTPNIHLCTIADFVDLTRCSGAR